MPDINPKKAALKANAAQMAKLLDAGGAAMQDGGLPELLSLKAGQQVGARRFTLVKPLGRGGMGVVWLAHDTRLDESVALKFLPPEISSDPVALNDLRRETVRSHHLTHPNIIRIHDFQQSDDVAFISMEYVDGATLSDRRLQQTLQVLTWEQLAPLAQQLCAALEYAHGENVIHRDLKPSNMMVDSKGRLKLADFGIAAVLSDSMSKVSVQHATSGTPPYMSPQQLAGKRPQVTDDIYALGATLYELLTGKPPFYTGDIVHQVMNQAPEPMEERLAALGIDNQIPPAVGAMVMACLAKEPGQRPQSARAVAEWIGLELEAKPSAESLAAALFPPGPPSLEPVEQLEPAGKAGSKPARFGRSLAAVGIVVLVMATAFWLRRDIFSRGKSKAPVPTNVVVSTGEEGAEQISSTATPTTTVAPVPSTTTAAPVLPQGTATNPAALKEPDWISSEVPKPGADGWIVLFDGKRLYGCSPPAADIGSGKISIQDGCLRVDSTTVRFNLIVRDVVIRASLKKEGGGSCCFTARSDLKRGDCEGCFSGGNNFFVGQHVNGRPWRTLSSAHATRNYGGFFEMEFSVEGPNLALKADGQNICGLQDDSVMEAGSIGVGTTAPGISSFQSIEVRILDKTPSTATPAPLPPQGTVPNPAATADWSRGLVLYFSFDEPPKSGVVRDESGSGNDGQAVNVSWTAQGRRGGAFQFSRMNSYITGSNRPSLNPAQITVAAWIKTSYSDNVYRRIFDKGCAEGFALSEGGDFYWIRTNNTQILRAHFQNTGQLVWEIGDGPNNHALISTGKRMDDGQWHHLAATYDGAVQRFYLDARLFTNFLWQGRVPDNNYDLTIGANRSNPESSAPGELGASFNGLMDEVMMFNRALSPDEVRQLYELPSAPKAMASSAPAPANAGASPAGQR